MGELGKKNALQFVRHESHIKSPGKDLRSMKRSQPLTA
jgi:hypothetical protein